jgi:hypothetical protein
MKTEKLNVVTLSTQELSRIDGGFWAEVREYLSCFGWTWHII